MALSFSASIICTKTSERDHRIIAMYEEMHPDCIPFKEFDRKYYKIKRKSILGDKAPDYNEKLDEKKIKRLLFPEDNYIGNFSYKNDKNIACSYILSSDYGYNYGSVQLKYAVNDKFKKHNDYYRYCMLNNAKFSDSEHRKFAKTVKKQYKDFKQSQK